MLLRNIKNVPESAFLHAYLSFYYERSGRNADAYKFMNHAASINPLFKPYFQGFLHRFPKFKTLPSNDSSKVEIKNERGKKFLRQLYKMTLSEIRSRYRKTFAGFVWVLLSPIILFSIQAFVFKKVLKLQ